MFLVLPFNFIPMYFWGITMAGLNSTFSDKLPKPTKER